jgi:hypothetical protein
MNITGNKNYTGEVNFEHGPYIGGTQVTATAAELNKMDGVTASVEELNKLDGQTVTADEVNVLDGAPMAAVFTVGAEAANVINVAIQLNDANGSAVASRCGLKMYLSSDENGDTIEGNGPDSWAIGTDGILLPDGGDSLISGVVISEVDGDIDIDLTHAGEDTFYMNLVLPNGKVVTSGAITFDATT